MDPDSSPSSLYLLVLFVLTSLLYLFAALVEGAVSSLNRAKVQRLAERDPAAARRIEAFAERPAFYLTAAAVLKLSALVAASVALVELLQGERPWSRSLLAWLILVVGALVLGWILPRSVAASWPQEVALALAVPFRVLSLVVAPVARLVARATSCLAHLVGASEAPEGPVVTPAELKVMVAASEEEGLLEQGERTMIDNILELEEISVREIMVPRPDMVALPATATVREAVDTFIREGYSRLPVYRDTIDDVVGVLYGKDLFPLVVEGRLKEPVGNFVRPAYFVPESKKCDDLLRELQQQRVQIAIVVDEYGGTAGLVTIEDLLEEIVGEIQDEFDTEEQKIVPEGDGRLLVDGTVPIDDVNEALAVHLTAEEVDTIGGLVYEKLGRVPTIGDRVVVDRAALTVVAAHGRRVTRVRVQRLSEESPNGASPTKAPLEER